MSGPVQVATWNVNSLRVRLPHLRDWLAANPVDLLAVQETKLPDPDFPSPAQALGGALPAWPRRNTTAPVLWDHSSDFDEKLGSASGFFSC